MKTRWFVGGAIATLAIACGSGDDADLAESSATACATPGTATKPGASFRRDVVPLMNRSCTFSSCHGQSGSPHGIVLAGDSAAVRTRLLAQPATASTMPYVTPRDPTQSFLVRKAEGSLCGLECTNDLCGERMPKGQAPLTPDELTALRGWVADGAPDN